MSPAPPAPEMMTSSPFCAPLPLGELVNGCSSLRVAMVPMQLQQQDPLATTGSAKASTLQAASQAGSSAVFQKLTSDTSFLDMDEFCCCPGGRAPSDQTSFLIPEDSICIPPVSEGQENHMATCPVLANARMLTLPSSARSGLSALTALAPGRTSVRNAAGSASSSPRAVQLATGLTPFLTNCSGSRMALDCDGPLPYCPGGDAACVLDDEDDDSPITCCFEKALHCLAMVDRPPSPCGCPDLSAQRPGSRMATAPYTTSDLRLSVQLPSMPATCSERSSDCQAGSGSGVLGPDNADTGSSGLPTTMPAAPATVSPAATMACRGCRSTATTIGAASTLMVPAKFGQPLPTPSALPAIASGLAAEAKPAPHQQVKVPSAAALPMTKRPELVPVLAESEPVLVAPQQLKAFHHKTGGPCDHCGATESPQWRRGPPHKPMLCNACGTRYRRTNQLGTPASVAAARAERSAAAAVAGQQHHQGAGAMPAGARRGIKRASDTGKAAGGAGGKRGRVAV